MKSFEQLCWVVTMLAGVIGAARLVFLSLSSTGSAPAYAAEAAGICAMVIVPYVFSRAIEGFRRTS